MIFEAASQVGGSDEKLSQTIAQKVLVYLQTRFPKTKNFVNGDVENAIEKVLIEEGHAKTAKVFILSRQEKETTKKVKNLVGVEDDLGLPLNSLIVLKNKYLQKNGKGEIRETPRACFERVARFIAKAETEEDENKWTEGFARILENLEFLPGGRTLANAGGPSGQLANCFVLPMEDNIEEMFNSIKEGAILKKNGGGVGFSFSKIRPKGDVTRTASGACGPVALMRVLDASSEILLQDGGRRSGNMVVISVSHPDIFEFITAKEADHVLPHINYSLTISDRFMEAVEKDKDWELINPRTGLVVQKVHARSIFELAASMAWRGGDPGMIFLDRINRGNPTPHLGRIEAVNLCGEQPLLPYEACNLGSINLIKFINESTVGGRVDFNWKKLEEVIRAAVRFLDDVIDVCRYPLVQVDRMVRGNRKIGLGIMGWADVLVKMGIAYDDEEALKLANRVMKFISNISHDESQKIGREKGSFPNFEGSRWRKRGFKSMRNATTTTIAPTGSISMVAGVSSGIEPLFALSYYKEVFGGVRLPEINNQLLKVLEDFKPADRERIKEEIIKNGSVQKIKEIPARVRKVFVTAHEIPYEWHLKMQAAFQKYTDNAVSKTINLPYAATVSDVQNAFILAWKLGCKGITIYRDQSRPTQVLNVGSGMEAGRQASSTVSTAVGDQAKINKGICPQCGAKLIPGDGCFTCPSCNFSVCEV